MDNEAEHGQNMTRAWLESWIEENEKPSWYDWFWLYPAKTSVNAAKVTLAAMNDHDLFINTSDSFALFRRPTSMAFKEPHKMNFIDG